uniref:RNase H type-1 domain-containing protein n=1 Tax=Cannabis sativa TaxID=3483 RepID=A0A803QQ43_CANSA
MNALYARGWESVCHALFRCTRAEATERTKEVHGTKPKPAPIICTFAEAYIDQFRNAKAPATPSKALKEQTRCSTSATPVMMNTSTSPQIRWLPPATGSYKINVDAAYDAEGSIIGIGAIVRDYARDVSATFSKSLRG